MSIPTFLQAASPPAVIPSVAWTQNCQTRRACSSTCTMRSRLVETLVAQFPTLSELRLKPLGPGRQFLQRMVVSWPVAVVQPRPSVLGVDRTQPEQILGSDEIAVRAHLASGRFLAGVAGGEPAPEEADDDGNPDQTPGRVNRNRLAPGTGCPQPRRTYTRA